MYMLPFPCPPFPPASPCMHPCLDPFTCLPASPSLHAPASPSKSYPFVNLIFHSPSASFRPPLTASHSLFPSFSSPVSSESLAAPSTPLPLVGDHRTSASPRWASSRCVEGGPRVARRRAAGSGGIVTLIKFPEDSLEGGPGTSLRYYNIQLEYITNLFLVSSSAAWVFLLYGGLTHGRRPPALTP